MKDIRYRIEALALSALFALFRLLPLDASSWLGGFLARRIGPFLKAHRIATRNLEMIFPTLAPQERSKIVRDMWDHLGRVAAEFANLPNPHLHERMTVSGTEYIPQPGKQVIFFSGHFGNWEMTYPNVFHRGLPLTLIYRHANNPYVDAIVNRLRAAKSGNMLPKGPRGAIKLVRALKNGESLAILVDQKMNAGIAVDFFGRKAMTAPAIALLALRHNLPIIPTRVVRTGGCHFQCAVYPPLSFEKTGDMDADVLTLMTKINAMLESWVREYPAQWFWVHKRWPSE